MGIDKYLAIPFTLLILLINSIPFWFPYWLLLSSHRVTNVSKQHIKDITFVQINCMLYRQKLHMLESFTIFVVISVGVLEKSNKNPSKPASQLIKAQRQQIYWRSKQKLFSEWVQTVFTKISYQSMPDLHWFHWLLLLFFNTQNCFILIYRTFSLFKVLFYALFNVQ